MEAKNLLIYLAIKHNGDWDSIYSAINNREGFPSEEDANKVVSSLKCKCVTIMDENYPAAVKSKCFKPPFVLFYYGDLSIIQEEKRCISVIGSRNCSSYGKQITMDIVGNLPQKYTIVSGLAKGIDAHAHDACLIRKGKTAAILGCGIDYCYPRENQQLYEQIKKQGIVLSEYPGKTLPCENYFPFRNRLVAALSCVVVVTEASAHSGTSITSRYAIDSGKEVACVPTRAGLNSLCNRIIRDGGALVESADDILDLIGDRRDEPVFDL